MLKLYPKMGDFFPEPVILADSRNNVFNEVTGSREYQKNYPKQIFEEL